MVETTVTISDKIKNLLQSGKYEDLILTLLNQSRRLFKNEFEHVRNQSQGQCDFVDLKTGEKYDAKLLITEKQGRLIGSRNSDYEQWLRAIMDEISEFGECIRNRKTANLEDSQLYKLMCEKLKSVKLDENAILFIPFTITHEPANSIYYQFATDILSVLFNKLNDNGLIGDRKVYAVYPSSDNFIIIRDLDTGVRESFTNSVLKKYIKFDVKLCKS
jgi:hypothetical protein